MAACGRAGTVSALLGKGPNQTWAHVRAAEGLYQMLSGGKPGGDKRLDSAEGSLSSADQSQPARV